MKIYIAGKIGTEEEIKTLLEIDELCKKLGFQTFLPHRDVGKCTSMDEVKMVFDGDITYGLNECGLVIANLNGVHVGAGTAWELGYAYAKGIRAIGFKNDETPEDGLDYLSAIIVGSIEIVDSLEKLEAKLKKL